MREMLNATLGFYRPTFFKIQINNPANLDRLDLLADIPSAIYLHEYIHFLQDLTTSYGLTNISTVVDYIKYVNELSLSNSSKIIEVPAIAKPSPNNEVSFNLKLNKERIGSTHDVAVAIITNVVPTTKVITLKRGNVDVENIIIDYKDKAGILCYHHFGSHCIMESMAFLVEQAIYPDVLPAGPHFPYNAAEKVVAFVYPELLSNSLNVLALCDASLSVFDSAEFFYENLIKMKNKAYIPNDPADIYNFCSENFSFNFNGISNFQDLLRYTSTTARNQLCDYFTTDIFKDNKYWINYTISAAVIIRLTKPHFILDIAKGGKIQYNNMFIEVLNKVGTPMVSNINDEAFFYTPIGYRSDVMPEFLWAISQIYGIYIKSLNNNEKKCELKLWCQESCRKLNVPDITDNNCYASPWLKVNSTNLCTFAAVWKTWGLTNKVPV